MPTDYIPPIRPLPFEFSTQGYTAPTNLLFDFKKSGAFGDLRAAVNVMQADTNPTYSYTKSCPKYVIGYNDGSIQIMYGKCLYGGIRSLQSAIYSYHAKDLNVSIGIHNPVYLSALIRGSKSIVLDFYALIHGYDDRSLVVTTKGGHYPVDLYAGIFVEQRLSRNLNSFIHVWHERYLQANITALLPIDLSAIISLIQPGELTAYLNTISVYSLPTYLYAWQIKDLGAFLNQMFNCDISAKVYGRDDMYKNLSGRLKGYVSTFSDLLTLVGGVVFENLTALVRAKYFRNITAFLYPVQPKDIHAILQVYHIYDLTSTVIGEDYPYYLNASIHPTGIFNTLQAIISCIKDYKNLKVSIHSFETSLLNAKVNASNCEILTAYLNAVGNSSSLHAMIYPKMIRLTTVVNISTMEHSNISATVNASCYYSTYRNLQALIDVKYKSELYAYIRAIGVYENKNLTGKIGYTDSYTTLDKLKLSINIYPTLYYTMDKLKLNISFINTQNILNAYIRGTLRYSGLNASITAASITKYTHGFSIKNREKVIENTYDGKLKSFQIVEMSFRSIVSEYYYSSDGDCAWKSNKFNRWMLDISSFLPSNIALSLKRRLHKVTTLYNLRKFDSVDEAIKFAIDYVTSTPSKDLLGAIKGIGLYSSLVGVIVPKYTRTGESFLSCSVVPISNVVIYDYSHGFINKI